MILHEFKANIRSQCWKITKMEKIFFKVIKYHRRETVCFKFANTSQRKHCNWRNSVRRPEKFLSKNFYENFQKKNFCLARLGTERHHTAGPTAHQRQRPADQPSQQAGAADHPGSDLMRLMGSFIISKFVGWFFANFQGLRFLGFSKFYADHPGVRTSDEIFVESNNVLYRVVQKIES